MSAAEFLDSNILVYAYDVSQPTKRKIALAILTNALNGSFALSTQVLGEFASILLYKLSPAVTPNAVLTILQGLAPIRTVSPDADMVQRAVEAHARYGLHFYDGLIVAAAERAGCTTILSEDMNAGQKYFGVEVVNPFATP